MINNGKNLTMLSEKLIEYFKNLIISNESDLLGVDKCYEILDILCKAQIDSKVLNNPNIIIEVAILKIIKLIQNSKKSDKIISREIILEEKCIDITENITKSDIVNNISEKSIVSNYERIKNIRVNNAFATANKEKLERLKILWVGFSDYLSDNEYSMVSSYLIDGDLRVVGDSDVIISVKYDSIFENACKNIEKISALFSMVMKDNYRIALVSENDWNKLKQKYINDKKMGIVYKLQFEDEIVDNYVENLSEDDSNSYSSVVSDAISLFGDDILEIK